MIHDDKPPLDNAFEDFLEHHGVKGQKWGVRKPRNSGEIITARRSARRSFVKADDAVAKVHELRRSGASKKDIKTAEDRASSLRLSHLNNPDRVTGAHMTRGQKAALGVLALSGVGTIPIAAGVGANVVARRSVAKRQATGYYNRKESIRRHNEKIRNNGFAR